MRERNLALAEQNLVWRSYPLGRAPTGGFLQLERSVYNENA
jgi:hypothetical protein